jgi:hypothetical protein
MAKPSLQRSVVHGLGKHVWVMTVTEATTNHVDRAPVLDAGEQTVQLFIAVFGHDYSDVRTYGRSQRV